MPGLHEPCAHTGGGMAEINAIAAIDECDHADLCVTHTCEVGSRGVSKEYLNVKGLRNSFTLHHYQWFHAIADIARA